MILLKMMHNQFFSSCNSEEQFVIETAQSPLELNALQDKLPWLIAGNILWCIIRTLIWIFPRNLVHVHKGSKRGVLIQFHTQIF